MLEFIGSALLGLVEKELANSEPEIQKLVIDQLDKLSKLLFDYVQGKLLENNVAPENNPKD